VWFNSAKDPQARVTREEGGRGGWGDFNQTHHPLDVYELKGLTRLCLIPVEYAM